MFKNIIEICNKFNTALEHRSDPTEEEEMILQYLNIDLAKSIIHDLDEHNAKCIAKIILGYVENM